MCRKLSILAIIFHVLALVTALCDGHYFIMKIVYKSKAVYFYCATACNATHGIAKASLSVCLRSDTWFLWQNERNLWQHSYTTTKDHSCKFSFLSRKMAGWEQSLNSTWNFVQSDFVRALKVDFQSVFARGDSAVTSTEINLIMSCKAFTGLSIHAKMVRGDNPYYVKICQKLTNPLQKADFLSIFARSASAVIPRKESSINTNRRSTTSCRPPVVFLILQVTLRNYGVYITFWINRKVIDYWTCELFR